MTLLTELCDRSGLFRIFSPYPFVQPPPAWPNAPGRSNYGEVVSDFHDKTDAAKCWFNRLHGRSEPRPAAGVQNFVNHDSAAFFSVATTPKVPLGKKEESLGRVTFTRFGQPETKIFRQSRDKEIKSLLESGDSIFGGEQAFSEGAPGSCADFSLRGRLEAHRGLRCAPFAPDTLDANNPGEHRAKVAPKSRWCVVGWRDPHVRD